MKIYKEIKNVEGKSLPQLFSKGENMIKIESYYGLQLPNMYIEELVKEGNYGRGVDYTLHMYDENMEHIDSCDLEDLDYNIKKILNRYILKKYFPQTYQKVCEDMFGAKNKYSYTEIKLYSLLDDSVNLVNEGNHNTLRKDIDDRFIRVELNMEHEYNQQFIEKYYGDVKILFGYAEIYSIPYLIEKGIVKSSILSNPYIKL